MSLKNNRAKTIAEVEMRIKKHTTEHAVLIDKSGEILVEETGNMNEVDLTRISHLLTPGRVLTHNHPVIGLNFSFDDILIIANFKIDEIRAVDKKYWYSIRRTKNSRKFTAKEFKNDFQNSCTILLPEYAGQIGSGKSKLMLKRIWIAESLRKTLMNYNYLYSWGEW